MFVDNNLFSRLIKTIKEIDKDRNGYVTNQELDDILVLCLPELNDICLLSLFKPFTDPINNILVDYK